MVMKLHANKLEIVRSFSQGVRRYNITYKVATIAHNLVLYMLNRREITLKGVTVGSNTVINMSINECVITGKESWRRQKMTCFY